MIIISASIRNIKPEILQTCNQMYIAASPKKAVIVIGVIERSEVRAKEVFKESLERWAKYFEKEG